jgi:hypothetical protein
MVADGHQCNDGSKLRAVSNGNASLSGAQGPTEAGAKLD